MILYSVCVVWTRNVPCRLICLTTLFPAGSAIWKGCGTFTWGFAWGSDSSWMGLEVPQSVTTSCCCPCMLPECGCSVIRQSLLLTPFLSCPIFPTMVDCILWNKPFPPLSCFVGGILSQRQRWISEGKSLIFAGKTQNPGVSAQLLLQNKYQTVF